MGEVYLAEDTRLKRKVAVKFLNEECSRDAETLKRFIQEAKAASALNHPNIMTVYEVGEHNGVNFIATEFIEGKTLRQRMKERLTFDETLSILIQAAEALSAAHRAGIIHRDIKPANIMIRSDGYVKVLDFGLAKLSDTATGRIDDSTWVKTSPGTVLGTPAYLSPEQARGKEVDARSDIFSLGVVMYEILAGHMAFTGETLVDVLTAILHSEPKPLEEEAPHVPKELQRIVEKTLKKNTDQRYHSTDDLLKDLKDLREQLFFESKLERTGGIPNKSQANVKSAPLHSTTSGSVKDALLIADFENTTGEAIFDRTLKTALAFSLAQSPFLESIPDARVVQTLRQMKREPNERVTRQVAEEICLRQNLKAYITGTISNFGTVYFLTLEAISVRTGESLGLEREQADSREEILAALGRAASGLREKLGESLSSIEKYDVAFEITTSSFEALKFYTFGREQENSGKTLEAIPFYRKALEFDPGFASVYAALAVIYANTNRWKLANEMAIKAFELRDSVSELEKLRISYFYYKYVTGEMDQAINTLELCRKTYALNSTPFVNLADCYIRLGQLEKAVTVCGDGLSSVTFSTATLYGNMAEALLALSRYEEAKEACREAIQRNFDSYIFPPILYQVAFIENDAAAMAENLKWFGGRNDEYLALDLETGTAAFRGKWRAAQDFSRRTIDLADRSGMKEVAAKFAAEQALRIVFWSSGAGLPRHDDSRIKTVLKTQTNKALNLERGKEVMSRAALALALAGQAEEADALAVELLAARPKDTLLNELWLPLIRAALCLQSKAKDAIEELEITERFERAGEFYPQYLRGLAYLQLNKPKNAAREFDKILKHRGEAPLSSVYPLARLGKARAIKDKAEYEKFFELWKDADEDMPALLDAKKEYENLK